MFIDNDLQLSAADQVLATEASESYLDQVAAGDAMGAGCYLHIVIDTAFAGTAGSSITFALQTATDTGFTTGLETVFSKAVSIASLTAGYVVAVVQLPIGLKRYVRAYYTCTGTQTAGKVDCRIVKDVTKTLDKKL